MRPAKDFGNPLNFSMLSVNLVPVNPTDGCGSAVNTEELEGEGMTYSCCKC